MHTDLFSLIVFSSAIIYIGAFVSLCPLGLVLERVRKDQVKHEILVALQRNIPVRFDEDSMKQQPKKSMGTEFQSDHTLGGIIDEMKRSGDIEITPDKEAKRWIITQPPQKK